MAVLTLTATTLLLAVAGCGHKKDKGETFESDVNQIVQKMEAAKKPYTGKLTPEKAAMITNEISVQSMKAFPADNTMPKDPKALMELNEKIRKKNEEIYAKHGTSMDEVTRYISSMNPKDREKYNKVLSDLFLEQSRKNYGQRKSNAPEKTTTSPATQK
jgi:hypothetical protein